MMIHNLCMILYVSCFNEPSAGGGGGVELEGNVQLKAVIMIFIGGNCLTFVTGRKSDGLLDTIMINIRFPY